MEIIWFLDRATGLLSYPALYLAVVTGIVYNTDGFGVLQRAARRVHIELSTFATLLVLAHGLVGTVDAFLVVDGAVPAPDYPMWYFVGGTLVGGGALLFVVVAVLGFVDARRFARPWGPRTVHAFAYAGYGFATVHMATVGSDVDPTWRLAALGGLVVVGYVLVVRTLVRQEILVVNPS